MNIPFLFTISLCALSPFAKAIDLLPKEEKVQITHLPNGVKTYVQEHDYPLRHGSFRVVLKRPHSEEELFRYDGMIESMESVEQFFHYCKQKASSQFMDALVGQSLNFMASDLPARGNMCPNEIAVVAVGDFPGSQMQSLIETHFGELILTEESLAPSIQIGIDPGITNVALSLGHCAGSKSVQTSGDLKEAWKSILLKDLFQQRLEICSRSLEKAWVHPYPRFFYPISGYSLVPLELSENLLSFFLFQDEAMRREGFFEDEFQRVKYRALGQLHYLASQADLPDNAFLASYFADQFLLGDCCPAPNAFMSASLEAVVGIDWQDIVSDMNDFLLEKNRYIQVTYPLQHSEILTAAEIEEMINESGSNFEPNRDVLATDRCEDEKDEEDNAPFWSREPHHFVLQVNETSLETESYYQLPISDKEKRMIKIIVNTMAEKNILQLALVKRSMEKKGKKIEHIHPMRFMGYILSNAELRSSLRTIKKSSFKWDAFIDGFSGRMKEEFANNNLYMYIPGFCDQVGVNPDEVAQLIQKKDWEGFVKAFM